MPRSLRLVIRVVVGVGGRRHRARRRSASRWIALDLLGKVRSLPRHALHEVRAWVARGEAG